MNAKMNFQKFSFIFATSYVGFFQIGIIIHNNYYVVLGTLWNLVFGIE